MPRRDGRNSRGRLSAEAPAFVSSYSPTSPTRAIAPILIYPNESNIWSTSFTTSIQQRTSGMAAMPAAEPHAWITEALPQGLGQPPPPTNIARGPLNAVPAIFNLSSGPMTDSTMIGATPSNPSTYTIESPYTATSHNLQTLLTSRQRTHFTGVDANASHHGELEFAAFEPITPEDTVDRHRVNTSGVIASSLHNPALPPAPVPSTAPVTVESSPEGWRSTQAPSSLEPQEESAAETSRRVMENTPIGNQLRGLLNGDSYWAANSELGPTGYQLRRLLDRGSADSWPSIQNRDHNSNNAQRTRTERPTTGGERCSAYRNMPANLDRVIVGLIWRNREARSNPPLDPNMQHRTDIGGVVAHNNRETSRGTIPVESLLPFVAPETQERARRDMLAQERGELIGHPNVAFRATHNVMLHYFFNDLYCLQAADLQRYARCANLNPHNEPWTSLSFIRRVIYHLSINASVGAHNRAARIERARAAEDAILQLASTNALSDSRAHSDALSAVGEVPHVWESRREEQEGEVVVFAIVNCATCEGFELQLSRFDNQNSGGTDSRVSWARLYCWAEHRSRLTHKQLEASLRVETMVSEGGGDEEGNEEWQEDEYWELGEDGEDNDDMDMDLPRWPRPQQGPVSPPMHHTHR